MDSSVTPEDPRLDDDHGINNLEESVQTVTAEKTVAPELNQITINNEDIGKETNTKFNPSPSLPSEVIFLSTSAASLKDCSRTNEASSLLDV